MKITSQTKIINYFIISLLVCLNFLSNITFSVAQEQQLTTPHVAGEILIKLKSSDKIYKFNFSAKDNLAELLNFYNSQPAVEYAEPNFTYQASLEPQDPYYTQQLYLSQIKAHQAWNITTGSSNITLAIIDSGVDINHPDLKNNIWTNPNEVADNGLDDDENGYTDDVHGWDFIRQTADPRPKLDEDYTIVGINHGTVVAGVAAAQGGNAEGIAGVSWRAKIMSLRVLDGIGLGDTLTVARAIDYARQQKVDVINLSFVGTGKSLTLEKAIKAANDAGILVVAAAGNEVANGIDMDSNPQYPVGHDGPNGENWVIGVASIDNNDRLASFSNYGKKYIDLSAPGVGIFSSVYHQNDNQNFQKYYESGWTGTSVSAPQVTGAAALIKSLKPNLSLQQIKDILLNTADNIDYLNNNYASKLGKGRLNIFAAVDKTLLEKPKANGGLKKIVVSPLQQTGPYVRIFKKTTAENQFFAFDEKFRGGISLAAGDLNDDGTAEILTGLGRGTYPWIKIFNQNGTLNEKIVAYTENFRGGVEVALGDVDGDGALEIISAAGVGGGPQVRIFSTTGIVEGQFFAFEKTNRSGLEIACGDVNQDGRDEIIVIKKSGDSLIKILDYSGELIASFYAYDKKSKQNVHLAAGDLDNDGLAEIVTGTGSGFGPQIKIFDKNGNLKNSFLAYAANFRGGVYPAVGDVDDDGEQEIVTSPGPGGGPHIRVFNMWGGVKFQFFAYDTKFRGGVRVAVEK